MANLSNGRGGTKSFERWVASAIFIEHANLVRGLKPKNKLLVSKHDLMGEPIPPLSLLRLFFYHSGCTLRRVETFGFRK